MGFMPPKPPESGAWKPQEPENITFTDDSWWSVVVIMVAIAVLLAMVL